MPNIKPISDLRSYTAVLDELTQGSPVFLTKSGRGRGPFGNEKTQFRMDCQSVQPEAVKTPRISTFESFCGIEKYGVVFTPLSTCANAGAVFLLWRNVT